LNLATKRAWENRRSYIVSELYEAWLLGRAKLLGVETADISSAH